MTQRRIIILRAAQRLLLHYGPGKTTVADIAREASVGVGSVYLEFTSKDAILEALSETAHAEVLERERRAWDRGGTAHERLRRVFDARLEAFARVMEESVHARDLLHCDRRAIARVHRRFVADEEALLASMVRAGMEAGELPPGDAETVARGLLRAYAAFAPPLLFHEPVEALRRDLPVVHELVLGRG